jgi:hypothetical protein
MKSPITEKHTKSIVGTLDINPDTNIMTMELDELGNANLADLFAKFNGQHVTININLKSEPEE